MGKSVFILCAVLLSVLGACSKEIQSEQSLQPVVSQLPAVSVPAQPDSLDTEDKPTIPDNVAEGTEYLYDFQFSKRYDERITEEFSFALPDTEESLYLFEKYENGWDEVNGQILDGEGMEPHIYKRYRFATEQREWIVVTDYYEPDNMEYVSYLWTTVAGAQTGRNVAVGSPEKELLDAYPTDLYYIPGDRAELSFFARDVDGVLPLTFDYAYAWQPYTRENGDIRDITFYLKDSKIVAMEMLEPYELRYVYGYDREAGLKYAQQQREKS